MERQSIKFNKIINFILVFVAFVCVNYIFTQNVYAGSLGSGTGGRGSAMSPDEEVVFKKYDPNVDYGYQDFLNKYMTPFQTSSGGYYKPQHHNTIMADGTVSGKKKDVYNNCKAGQVIYVLVVAKKGNNPNVSRNDISYINDKPFSWVDPEQSLRFMKANDKKLYNFVKKGKLFDFKNQSASIKQKTMNTRFICLWDYERCDPKKQNCDPKPKCDPTKENCDPTKEKKCDPTKENCDKTPPPKKKCDPSKEDCHDCKKTEVGKLEPSGGGKVTPYVPSGGRGSCPYSDYDTEWIDQGIYGDSYPKKKGEMAMTEYKHITKRIKPAGLKELFEEKEKAGYIKSASEQMAEWERTHHNDSDPKGGGSHKTEYYKLLYEKFDAENLGGKIKGAGKIKPSEKIVDEASKKVNEILKKDEEHIKNLDKSQDTFKLSDANQIGLSRGGAFTITKMIKEEKVTIQTQGQRKYRVYCTEYSVCTGSGEDRSCETYHSWDYYEKDQRIKPNPNSFFYSHHALSDFVPYQSFQVVNVICSKEDLKRITKETGTEFKIKSETNYSLLMHTKKLEWCKEADDLTPENMHARLFYDGKCYYKPRLDPKDPSKVIEPKDKNETGRLVCSSDPTKAPNGSDGKNNKQDKGKPQNSKGKDLFGAQFKDEESDEVKEKNSGQFQFFRDNVLREIRSDIWSINDKEGSSDIQIKPTYRTDLVLWEGSTPDPFGKNLEIQVNDQKIDWNKGNKVEDGVNEGIGGKFRSGYLKSYEDEEINKFKYSATWASEGAKNKEEARPTRMLITYNYNPLVKSTKVKSFKMHEPKGSLAADGKPVVNIAGKDDQKIDAACDVFYNEKGDKKPRIGIFPKYSKNKPEKRKYQEGFKDKNVNQEPDKHRNGGKENEKSNTNNELTVNFVKTSKE